MANVSTNLINFLTNLKNDEQNNQDLQQILANHKAGSIKSKVAAEQIRALIAAKLQTNDTANTPTASANENEREYYFPLGILTYLEELTKKDTKLTPNILIEGGDNKFQLEVAITYSTDYSEKLFAFTNGIINPEHGAHVTGLRTALTKLINQYATSRGVFKKEGEKFSYDDIKEGLRVVLSVKMVDPQFTSQSKVKLGSTIARTLTEKLVSEQLGTYLEENPSVINALITKAQLALKARLAAKAARESVLRKGVLESTSLPGKLADCSEKDPAKSEIYIVEGDSAGGSAKQGRNRQNQAILPLRGKVLNTERATLDRIMNYDGIKNMIIAFGTGIGDRFDIEKLRYHKIILMTDADVDGAHITTLLLTFLYRYTPQLIEGGFVYMARPPLYQLKWGKRVEYVYSEPEKIALLKEIAAKDPNITLESAFAEEESSEVSSDIVSNELQTESTTKVPAKSKAKKIGIQRYKGLGEMNPEQLWETTMDPSSRLLYQVTVGEALMANQVFDELMGADVDPRKKFIEENAVYAEVDII